jgi:hypothetical protein
MCFGTEVGPCFKPDEHVGEINQFLALVGPDLCR